MTGAPLALDAADSEPQVAFHVTEVLAEPVAPVTVAVKLCVAPAFKLAVVGDTETRLSG